MDFWEMTKYRAVNGQMIEVTPYGKKKRPQWQYHFIGSSMWFVGFKTKFDAILSASRDLRSSMQKLDWSPMKTE